ncbi:nuclear transport factor 2 family protein [Microbulbifer sediminum]|uniref:nuclear transport factor 2 family protein n=1 Tax=Microbulbifer sediminum TaxID=2904250 RepID=UPI001F465A27|nr:nuclear transport factor 2 family protein [Microbulbifer sediminum]
MFHKVFPVFFTAIFISLGASASPDANKELVTNFYNEVILRAGHEAIDKYIGDQYIQHNPNLSDGKEALRRFIKSVNPGSAQTEPSGEIVRAIAEGDLVVLHVKHYHWPGKNGGAIVDIFRVADGKIVEHWDVIQAVPEKSANENTMF